MNVRKLLLEADEIFHKVRWGNKPVTCPYCGSTHVHEISKYHYRCTCHSRFSDKTKTMLHKTHLPTWVWLYTIYEMISNSGISNYKLAQKLNISVKTAFYLQQRIRIAMQLGDGILCGIIIQDETYLGGSLHNFHYARKLNLLRTNKLLLEDESKVTRDMIFSLNSILKQPIFGMCDNKHVVLCATPNPINSSYVRTLYNKYVNIDSSTITVADETKLYKDWITPLHTNNHSKNQYKTKTGFTSNTIENHFSWLKRRFENHHVHCDRRYSQLYLNEFSYIYNNKDEDFYTYAKVLLKRVTLDDVKKYDSLKDFTIKKRIKPKLGEDEIKKMLQIGFIKSIQEGHRHYYKK